MFPGARGFHRSVQRKQVGLARYLLHDHDLVGDCLHRGHGFTHGFTAGTRIRCRLAGNLLRLIRIACVLLDVGSHLLHRRGRLFGRGCLLGGALRQLLRGGRHLLAAGSDVARRRHHLGDDLFQLDHHGVQGIDEVANFVTRRLVDRLCQVARGDDLGERAGAGQRTAYAEHDPEGGGNGDRDRADEYGDHQKTRTLIGGLRLGF
ncbi:hypothetical protein GALL_542000 [mine drainage metagenome]|uniref:NAD-specific glutamate dehydrogenase n=1 Tax=mine drainage metagenome TaxID=410659 RepID=A0A1J5NZP5_9ZZZZ